MNEKFTFFRSFYEAIKEIEDEGARLDLYEAICAYALEGEEVELTGVPRMLFTLIKPNIDASNKKRTGGATGGRKHEESKLAKDVKGSLRKSKKVAFQKEESKLTKNVKGSLQKSKKVASAKSASDKEKDKEKEKDKDKGLGNGLGSRRKDKNIGAFAPPTVQEVKAYCEKRRVQGHANRVDAEEFCDHYAAQDWLRANGRKITDWKACVRVWEKKPPKARSGTKFSYSGQRVYNMPEVERRLLAKGRS